MKQVLGGQLRTKTDRMRDEIMMYTIQGVQPGDQLLQHRSEVPPGSRAGDQHTCSIAWASTRVLGSGWVEAPGEAGKGN